MIKRHRDLHLVGSKNSAEITFTGCAIHDETEEGQPNLPALLELDQCQRINITGSQFINGLIGIAAKDASHITLSANTIHDTREKPIANHGIKFTGKGDGNLAAHNSIGSFKNKAIEGNITDGN